MLKYKTYLYNIVLLKNIVKACLGISIQEKKTQIKRVELAVLF